LFGLHVGGVVNMDFFSWYYVFRIMAAKLKQ